MTAGWLSRYLAGLAFLACLTSALPLHAQDAGSVSPGSLMPAQAADPTTEDTAARSQARALIDVLRDDTARGALLAELERLVADSPAENSTANPDAAGAPDATPDTAPEAAAAPDTAAEGATETAPALGPDVAAEQPTLGARLADITNRAVEDSRGTMIAFGRGLSATWRRLAVLWSPRVTALYEPISGVAIMLAITVGVYTVTRWLSQRAYRALLPRLDRFGTTGRVLLGIASLLLNALAVMVAYVAGQAIAASGGPGLDSRALAQTLYLNAFGVVGVVKVLLDALLAPRRPRVRLLPLSDGAARFWRQNLVGIAVVLGYGLMLAVPVISTILSVFTARAVTVLVLSTALIWSMVLVIRYRQAPRAWLERRAEETGVTDATQRMTLAIVSVWHLPALLYLLVLFVMAVSDTGHVGPFVRNTAEVVGVVTVGAVLITLLSRWAQRGITLPETLRAPFPMLEARLNGFLRSLLGTLRLALFIGTMLTAVQVAGFGGLPAYLTGLFGRDIGTAVFSVGMIVLLAFFLWLALVSFVDFRLNPERGVPPTARERTLLTLLLNAVTIALVVITAMISLSELGIDIAPLLASAGVLGLAIGFGAQKMVQDIITGVFIQFDNAINVGDVVTVAGITGVVEKLTIRSVSLRDVNGVYHIVPFSSVDMVSNFMRDFAFHLADIGIAYRENIDEAKEQMFKAFDDMRDEPEHGRVIIGPLEWMGVQSLGDSAVVVRARIRTRPGSQWAIGRAFNEAVKKRFDAAGIEIPFPHTTIWFGQEKAGGAPPVHVAQDPSPAAKPAPDVTLSSAAE